MTTRGFHYASPRSRKVACDVCGATGYDTGGGYWQERHLRGHAPCPRCGRLLTVKDDLTPRTHTRCPARGES